VRKWLNLLLFTAMLGISVPVQAASCPVPDAFVIPEGGLPATKAAIGRRALTILVLGGADSVGGPANGADFTYPSRLAARLSKALPGIKIDTVVLTLSHVSGDTRDEKVEASLTTHKPALVIWGPGGSAAGRGDDLDTFIGDTSSTIGKISTSGADMILMTLQYAPSLARVINLIPYRMAVLRAGDMAGVPVLDRYELMRFWSDNDFLDLDGTKAEERIVVARKLYDCMAEILTEGIVDAVH
jgi:acyl-CoA thioesterase I